MKTFTNDAAKAAYNEIYQLTKTLSAEDEGNLIARLMSDMLNHSQNTDVDAFLECWNQEHRTLQQRFTSLVAKWLQLLNSKEKDKLFDLRNAYSVGFAKGAMQGLKDFKFNYTEGSHDYHYEYHPEEDREMGFPYI